jgi:hypothetical protein
MHRGALDAPSTDEADCDLGQCLEGFLRDNDGNCVQVGDDDDATDDDDSSDRGTL